MGQQHFLHACSPFERAMSALQCRPPALTLTLACHTHAVVERAGVAGQFEIDSCGTGGGSSNWYLPGGFRWAGVSVGGCVRRCGIGLFAAVAPAPLWAG